MCRLQTIGYDSEIDTTGGLPAAPGSVRWPLDKGIYTEDSKQYTLDTGLQVVYTVVPRLWTIDQR